MNHRSVGRAHHGTTEVSRCSRAGHRDADAICAASCRPRSVDQRTSSSERRCRRRSQGTCNRRRLSPPRRVLPAGCRLPDDLARADGWGHRRLSGRLSLGKRRSQRIPADPDAHSPLYIGDSSDVGIELATDHVEVYLTLGEPRIRLRRNSNSSARGQRQRGVRCVSASGFTPSSGRRRPRLGPMRID